MSAIDPDLLADLDRSLRKDLHASSPTPEAAAVHDARFDISAILEAVQLTASSMGAMADRVQELEAHSEAFETSNQELEVHARQLAAELDEAVRQRDAMAMSLQAEIERVRQLESLAAQHIIRTTSLERDLELARADLAKIVEVVESALGLLT